MASESFVDEDDNKASAELHAEWRETYAKYVFDNMLAKTIDARVQVQEVTLVAQFICHKDEGDDLC